MFPAYIGVLAAALSEGLTLDWALQRVQELGFEVSQDARPDVYSMYCDTFTTATSQGEAALDKEEL